MSICDTPARGTGSEPNVVSPKQCAARLVKQRRGSNADSVAARALSGSKAIVTPGKRVLGKQQQKCTQTNSHADNNCKISLSAGPVQEAARTKGVQGSDAGVQYASRVHVGGVKGLRECSEV